MKCIFEDKYKDEGKWNYPFGQRFIMEELDDCGAMGASVIEVYRRDKQERCWRYCGGTPWELHVIKAARFVASTARQGGFIS
ncbi:MAG: hypothetical protein ACRENG_05755 [bacterium]